MDFTPDTIFEEIQISSDAYSAAHLQEILETIAAQTTGIDDELKNALIDAIQQEVLERIGKLPIESGSISQEDIQTIVNNVKTAVLAEIGSNPTVDVQQIKEEIEEDIAYDIAEQVLAQVQQLATNAGVVIAPDKDNEDDDNNDNDLF